MALIFQKSHDHQDQISTLAQRKNAVIPIGEEVEHGT